MEVKTEKQDLDLPEPSSGSNPSRQKSLEEIAEKWAMKLNGNHFHLPFDGPVMCYVRELFLLACTEACQSRDVELRILRTNYEALRELFDLNPAAAYARLEKAESRIQRLKEALEGVIKHANEIRCCQGGADIARAALSEENKNDG